MLADRCLPVRINRAKPTCARKVLIHQGKFRRQHLAASGWRASNEHAMYKFCPSAI
jgi:hypothetical protein